MHSVSFVSLKLCHPGSNRYIPRGVPHGLCRVVLFDVKLLTFGLGQVVLRRMLYLAGPDLGNFIKCNKGCGPLGWIEVSNKTSFKSETKGILIAWPSFSSYQGLCQPSHLCPFFSYQLEGWCIALLSELCLVVLLSRSSKTRFQSLSFWADT